MMKPPLTIRLCAPRGFCAGVDRAVQIVIAALKKYGAPVYVRHEIVHNRYVVEGLAERGAVFVQELHEIPQQHYDRPVVFSAHGVPKAVPAEAERRNLFYLDATCPLVSKVHKQALRHYRKARHVILIGHAGHPEVIGTMGQLPEGAVSLIETVADAEAYSPPAAALGFVSQTTLSVEDTQDIIAVLQRRFPSLAAPAAESICYATTNRQDSVKQAAPNTDLFLIVGAPNSSNSRRLVEVAKKFGAKQALLIQSAHELSCFGDDDMANLRESVEERHGENRETEGGVILEQNLRVIGLSAGASAPEIVVNKIIDTFKEHYNVKIDLVQAHEEHEFFLLNRAVRDIVLDSSDMAFLNGEKSFTAAVKSDIAPPCNSKDSLLSVSAGRETGFTN